MHIDENVIKIAAYPADLSETRDESPKQINYLH